MITKTSATITNLKNLFIEMFLDKTAKVSNVADGSVVNATAFGVAKVAQKAMKDIAIKEAQIFPDTATGAYLDKAAALYGVSPRKGALGSSTYIRVSADPGTVYGTDVTFVNKNGIRFQVDEALTVGESGYGYVKVRSVNAGYSTNVPPNSITNVNPQPQGHIECTNEYYAIGGRDSEDDETFRIRIKNNLNVLSKNTIEYWTQVLNGVDDRVLKVMTAGLDEQGVYNLYIVSQNGIFFTEDELGTLLEKVQGYFGLSELNIEGKVVGIAIKNIDWFYVGSERGLDFRVQLQPDYDVATVRQNIQINLTKYLDFRFWTPGNIVEWDDLLDIVKKTDGVKYVPDEYFFPYYDQQVPANQLPRIRGFVMRDQDGNVLYDSDSNLSPLFYPAESEDLFVGLNDNSLNLYQSAYFNVKDQDGNPIKGANISVNNNGILTNDQGQGTLQLANGQYEYTVSADGYIAVTGTFVVLNGSVSIEVEMVRAPYTVTFIVTDETGALVPYATIQMDNRSVTTNVLGQASISVKSGDYSYTITKTGYDDYKGNVSVTNSDVTVRPEMELKAYQITLIVKDTLNAPIPTAIININNGPYITDEKGEVTIPLVNGTYNVEIQKTGFDTLKGSFTVDNKDADVTFEMTFFLYDVYFRVMEGEGTPSEGATITIESERITLTTGKDGMASTKLRSANYTYTISKKGYDDASGSFNVAGVSTTVERTLVLKHYNVTVTVLDSDNSSPIQGAVVNINNGAHSTGENGQVKLSLQNGSYPYTVTRLGYYDNSGQVTVLDSDNSSVVKMQAKLYNVIIQVNDPNGSPIKNAAVTINNNTYQTQDNGQVSLQLKNGKYPYTVTASGMDTYTGSLEVVNQDIPMVTVGMEYIKYNVNIIVQTHEGVAVGGANIHINEQDIETSGGGLATIRLSNGTYPYTVTKEGWVQSEGQIEVQGTDKNVVINLVPLSYRVTFSVKDNRESPLAVGEAKVTVDDKEATTNGSGIAEIELTAGSYLVSVSHDGYVTETRQIEVTKAETFDFTLKKIWNLTFKVSAAEKSPLKDVTINVEGAALLNGNVTGLKTKEDGTTDPIQVINGAFSWNASLKGYSPEEGMGNIKDGDSETNVSLTFGFETTFVVKEGSTPVSGVSIVIDGSETITTDDSGTAKAHLSTGSHTYTYSKSGYQSGSGTVQVQEKPVTVNITMTAGALVTFRLKGVDKAPMRDIKIEVNQASKAGKLKARALPETLTTSAEGIATIQLPDGNYVYNIKQAQNENIIGFPQTSFTVKGENQTFDVDMTPYIGHNIEFRTNPTASGVKITLLNTGTQSSVQGTTISNGTYTFVCVNGTYKYTTAHDNYLPLTGEVIVNNLDGSISLNLQGLATVTFTVKEEGTNNPIGGAEVTMTGTDELVDIYKSTTNSSGVATMTYAGGNFEWSQDDDADYSGMFILPENETYTIPNDGVPGNQMKTYFPNGVVCSPLTIVTDGGSNVDDLMPVINTYNIDGWKGSWDTKKRNFTLTGVKKEGTPTVINIYVVFFVDAGYLFSVINAIMDKPYIDINYNKALDFGIKVSNVPENLKITATWGIVDTPTAVSLENDIIQRIQIPDLAFYVNKIEESTNFTLTIESSDGSKLSTDDIKNLNITISFYGKKFTGVSIPPNKVLYDTYSYEVRSDLDYKYGAFLVNSPIVNKEVFLEQKVSLIFQPAGLSDSDTLTVKITSGELSYTGTTTGNKMYTFKVPPGKVWNYEASCPGYVTITGTTETITELKAVVVNMKKALNVTFTLRENTTNGNPVQDATVKFINTSSSTTVFTGTTNSSGQVFPTVESGTYRIECTKSGYQMATVTKGIPSSTTITEKILKIYNSFNVTIRRENSSNYLPSGNIQLVPKDGQGDTKTMSIGSGNVSFSDVVYGNYNVTIPAGNYSEAYNGSVLVNSENQSMNISLESLYDVNITVKPSGGNITFRDSKGITTQKSTSSGTQSAKITGVHSGTFSINITGSGGESPLSTTGSISKSAQNAVDLSYTLEIKQPKLVQITSDQTNYALDTSYKYVSLLIVGRGGKKFEYWNSWDSFILLGGTTGQIVYIPNILISDISNGRINKITFSGVPNAGSWTFGTEYSITLGQTTYEYAAYNGVNDARNDADLVMPQRSNLSNYSVYNAKSSGAIAAHAAGTFYCSGSFGSQNAKEQTYSFVGPRMQPDGAPGGDGRYGFKSSYESPTLGNVTKPIKSSVTIPIQSIFGGTSEGTAGYLNTESGGRTGADAFGGAGYGGSYSETQSDGKTKIPGYGSGQEASPADDDAGNIIKPGEGIFCIYYHNETI